MLFKLFKKVKYKYMLFSAQGDAIMMYMVGSGQFLNVSKILFLAGLSPPLRNEGAMLFTGSNIGFWPGPALQNRRTKWSYPKFQPLPKHLRN